MALNAPGLAWRAVSLDALREIAGLDAFPSLPAAVKARTMALPEPQPGQLRQPTAGGGQRRAAAVAVLDRGAAKPAGGDVPASMVGRTAGANRLSGGSGAQVALGVDPEMRRSG